MESNIYDKGFSGDFLVNGSCLPSIRPEIVDKFKKRWKNVFTFCLEQNHYNMFVAKLFDILAVGNTKKVGFLTVEGSPHCVQLHYASKFMKRGLKIQTIEYEHFVIRKDGTVFQIPMDAIDKSRDFSLVGNEVNII